MALQKAKAISELKDTSWKTIAPKSCSDYKDYFALDNPTWAAKLYKRVEDSYLYVPEMPNKPSGR